MKETWCKKQDVYKGTSDTTIKERERKQEEEKKQTEAKQMMPSVSLNHLILVISNA